MLGAAGARRARGPVLGVVLVAVVYTAVLVVAGSVGAVEAAPGLVLPDLGPGAGRVVSLLVALVAVLFCTRNLSTAAGLAVEALTGAPATVDTLRRSALAVGAVALLGTALVVREWLGATDVLSVPDAMALVVFLGVSASAALARRRQDVGMTGGVRAGTVALAAHLPLSFFAGPALALPLLLLGAFTGRAPPRTAGPTDDAEEFHTGHHRGPAHPGGLRTARKQSVTGRRHPEEKEQAMTPVTPSHAIAPNALAPNAFAPNDISVFEQHESQVRLYSRKFPVVFTRGRGAWLHSEDGRDFLDFFCGASALNYGHNPPDLKERLQAYLAQDGLIHGLDLYTTAKRDFLTVLRRTVLDPHELPHKVQFCGPTGTDAVEAALKVARKATGQRTVVAFAGAFHGMTRGSLSVTGSRRPGMPAEWICRTCCSSRTRTGPAGRSTRSATWSAC